MTWARRGMGGACGLSRPFTPCERLHRGGRRRSPRVDRGRRSRPHPPPMASRSVASTWTLGAVQTGYLLFAAVYALRHGLPVFGEGRHNPYLAYLALNIFTV